MLGRFRKLCWVCVGSLKSDGSDANKFWRAVGGVGDARCGSNLSLFCGARPVSDG